MGANFETMIVAGAFSKAEVEKRFESAQDDDRYENGHSYSGGFGMATGLTFRDETLSSASEAYEFLDETCVKWENAVAVRFKKEDGDHWMIGAVCAS